MPLTRVGRHRVLQHIELPEAEKTLLVQQGIDPDTLFTIAASFDDDRSAKTCLAVSEMLYASPLVTFRYHDFGEAEMLEMPVS